MATKHELPFVNYQTLTKLFSSCGYLLACKIICNVVMELLDSICRDNIYKQY